MNHLKENSETYFSHMIFAGKIAFYLSVSSTFFLLHSVFPFIAVPDIFNLEAVSNNMNQWNSYAENRKSGK